MLLSQERSRAGQSGLVTRLREEILQVISRHLEIDGDKVIVNRDLHVSRLEIEVEIPGNAVAQAA